MKINLEENIFTYTYLKLLLCFNFKLLYFYDGNLFFIHVHYTEYTIGYFLIFIYIFVKNQKVYLNKCFNCFYISTYDNN